MNGHKKDTKMSKQLIRYLAIFIVVDLCLTEINATELVGEPHGRRNWSVVFANRHSRSPIFPQHSHSEGGTSVGKHEPRDAPCNHKHQEPDPPYADLCNHPCNRECSEHSDPMVCRYTFRIENYVTMSKACYDCPYTRDHCFLKDCIAADGVQDSVIVINRQMPGPPIEVCQGDMIEVVVDNEMLDGSTSIHWHGMHLEGFQYMDGVPKVTQCNIPPDSSFLYRFNASTPGTHFYHSHSGLQRSDGLFGALVVRVPLARDQYADMYDYDLSDHVFVIMDHLHLPSTTKFVAHHHSNGNNKPTSMLVNGRGRFQDFNNDGNEVLHTPMETFTVNQGYRYRFRLINAGSLNCPIELSVDNHTLLVISSDGSDLEPVEAKSIITYAGERFDFIIDADEEIGNYWMRFRGLMDCDERFNSVAQGAILHYHGAPEDEDPPGKLSYDIKPSGLQVNLLNSARNSSRGLLMAEMRSAPTVGKDPRLKPEADVKFFVSYDFYRKNNKHYNLAGYYGFNQTDKKQRLTTPQLNHISLKFPPFPLLTNPGDVEHTEFCNSSVLPENCETDYCECIHLLRVPLGAVAEVILIDKGFTFDANHPFHLHGYNFRVIGMDRLGTSVTEEQIRQMDEDGLLMRNLRNAPIKDTVTVNDGGYTIIRFHGTNPGYWLFHCHLEFHMEIGMALIFKVGEESDFPPIPDGFPTCNNYLPKPQMAAMKSFANGPIADSTDRQYEIEGSYLTTSDGPSSQIVSPITTIISLSTIFIFHKFLT